MTGKLTNFKQAPNPQILNAIRNQASRDYRERIPEATQANIEQIAQTMNTYSAMRNEFIDALVNRIGLEVFRELTWNNPLAEFKQGMLPFGSTVEEIQVGLAQARVHDETRDSLEKDVFGRVRIDVQTSFHTENRKDKYKITIDDVALKRAFLSEFGISKMVTELMSSQTTADEYDEFLLMANLLVMNEELKGYHKVHVDEVTGGNEASAKALLVAVREYKSRLEYLSTKYNASGMHVSSKAEDMLLITTPRVAASLDVDAYAAAFNLDRAKVPYRLIAIPEEHWPIEGAQAILTDKSFFQVWDTYFDTTEMHNPDGLYRNFWLHHHQIISLSRFVPAILFTTEEVTPETNTPLTVTSVTKPTLVNGLTGAAATKLERGYYFQVVSAAKTNQEGIGEGVTLTIEGAESEFTSITNTGALVVGADETATKIKVVSVSTVDASKSNSVEFEVEGDIAQRWPDVQVVPDPGQPTPTP